MGKNLKGKDCGRGITQRKDGKYYARFTNSRGKRTEGYFDTLPEARNWLDDARYEDKHGTVSASSLMTVDAWFQFWITSIICDRAPNTLRNYRERYKRNIEPVIGGMIISQVKPVHCKIILNKMNDTYDVPGGCGQWHYIKASDGRCEIYKTCEGRGRYPFSDD